MHKSSQGEIKELEQMKKNMEEYLRIMPTDSIKTLEPDKPHER